MKPLIGITSRRAENTTTGAPFLFGQWHTYAEAVSRAGGIPVYLPIFSDHGILPEVLGRLDGVLFSGGDDIGSVQYHQQDKYVRGGDSERDDCEISLMRLTLDANKPLLGICRGMQLLNVVRGGTLYQDIEKEVPDALNHDGYPYEDASKHVTHRLQVAKGSRLGEVLGEESIMANSMHHQAVNEVGLGLTVNATAEDGIVEGLEDMSQGYVMSVQLHPETLAGELMPKWQPMFESFIDAAKQFQDASQSTVPVTTFAREPN